MVRTEKSKKASDGYSLARVGLSVLVPVGHRETKPRGKEVMSRTNQITVRGGKSGENPEKSIHERGGSDLEREEIDMEGGKVSCKGGKSDLGPGVTGQN